MCGRCSQMCRDTLFSWRPLLSFCCGLLVGSIPVQDDIIVQAKGRKYCKNIIGMQIYCMPVLQHRALLLNSKRIRQIWATFCSHGIPSLASFLPCTLHCQISRRDRCVVYLLAEAEHGYASMPPFISSRERESLKRKNKSKKNTSSR